MLKQRSDPEYSYCWLASFFRNNCLWNLKSNADKFLHFSYTQIETRHKVGKWHVVFLQQMYLNLYIKKVFIFKGITSGSHVLISIVLPNIFGTLPSKLLSKPASNSFRCLFWQEYFIYWVFNFESKFKTNSYESDGG